MNLMRGYWFCRGDRLGYGDDREARVGTTHRVECEPVLCMQGLHASAHVMDALRYAPGPILYRVKLSDGVVRGSDKAVARERTYLARIDATRALRKFARMCALDVIDKWDAPEVVVAFLKTGDESLRAAADAAADRAAVAAVDAAAVAAANVDAKDAAWDAARAAMAAARDAKDAAGAAAEAAGAARRDDAGAAARAAQKSRLARMINAEFKHAASNPQRPRALPGTRSYRRSAARSAPQRRDQAVPKDPQ